MRARVPRPRLHLPIERGAVGPVTPSSLCVPFSFEGITGVAITRIAHHCIASKMQCNQCNTDSYTQSSTHARTRTELPIVRSSQRVVEPSPTAAPTGELMENVWKFAGILGKNMTRRDETRLVCTDLVVYPLGGVGQLDALLELVADLFHLLALAPVIEGPCHVDLVAGVRPVMQRDGRVSLDAPIQLAQIPLSRTTGSGGGGGCVCPAQPPLRFVLVDGREMRALQGPMIAVVLRLRSNRLVGAPRMAGPSLERHGRGEPVEVVDWIGAGACAGRLWSPRSGVREAC